MSEIVFLLSFSLSEKPRAYNRTYSPALLLEIQLPEFKTLPEYKTNVLNSGSLYSGTIAIAPECQSINCRSTRLEFKTFYTPTPFYTPAAGA